MIFLSALCAREQPQGVPVGENAGNQYPKTKPSEPKNNKNSPFLRLYLANWKFFVLGTKTKNSRTISGTIASSQ